MRCREFVVGLLGIVAAAPVAAHAQEPAMRQAQATTANVPKIEVVRVRAVHSAAPSFRLGDGRVDLSRAFSLSSPEGIGGAWGIPPYIALTGNAFDERYGRW